MTDLPTPQRRQLLADPRNPPQLLFPHYSNRALDLLRDQGYPVLDVDAERLSAFIRDHIGIDGHYAFHLPDLGGAHRPLRDPDARDD